MIPQTKEKTKFEKQDGATLSVNVYTKLELIDKCKSVHSIAHNYYHAVNNTKDL